MTTTLFRDYQSQNLPEAPYMKSPECLDDRKHETFKQLSEKDKKLYIYLRRCLAINQKFDNHCKKDGRFYVNLTLRKAQEHFGWAIQTVVNCFKKLENLKLIERIKRSKGGQAPAEIYVNDCNQEYQEELSQADAVPEENSWDENTTEIYDGNPTGIFEDLLSDELEKVNLSLCITEKYWHVEQMVRNYKKYKKGIKLEQCRPYIKKMVENRVKDIVNEIKREEKRKEKRKFEEEKQYKSKKFQKSQEVSEKEKERQIRENEEIVEILRRCNEKEPSPASKEEPSPASKEEENIFQTKFNERQVFLATSQELNNYTGKTGYTGYTGYTEYTKKNFSQEEEKKLREEYDKELEKWRLSLNKY